jgi:MraZ protein
MSHFLIESTHQIDDKSRLIVPQRYRDAFAEGYVLTPAVEPCLWLWPSEVFTKVEQQLQQESALDPDVSELVRHLHTGTEGRLDGQGRLTITPSLRKYAQIAEEGQVVLVGGRGKMEVWSAPAWEDRPVDRDALGRAAKKIKITL